MRSTFNHFSHVKTKWKLHEPGAITHSRCCRFESSLSLSLYTYSYFLRCTLSRIPRPAVVAATMRRSGKSREINASPIRTRGILCREQDRRGLYQTRLKIFQGFYQKLLPYPSIFVKCIKKKLIYLITMDDWE